MKIREYQVEDQDRVCSLCERTFKPPDLTSPLYLARTIVEENGQLVGFGSLRLTAEAIIAVDGPTLVRARAVRELISTGIYQCQKLGLKDMHAFLTGPNQGDFEQALKKHYGFVGHTGNVLVLEV